MAELIAEATRWRVVLPVGVLKGITEADAYRLAAEHNVRPDRAVVRLYADGTEELGPWSPAPVLRLRTQAERDADGTTWRSDADAVIARVLAENAHVFQPLDPNRPPLQWRDIGDVPPPPRRRWWHRYTRRNP